MWKIDLVNGICSLCILIKFTNNKMNFKNKLFWPLGDCSVGENDFYANL